VKKEGYSAFSWARIRGGSK